MTKEETAIGPWLLIPVLIVSQLGQGFINNPHFVTEALGNNAYWAFPSALFFLVPAMAVFYLLAKRFPGQNLIDQGKTILGSFLGAVSGLAYCGFISFFLAILTREVVNLTSMYYLISTPVPVLALCYLLTVAWLASRGIETITRTASMVLIPTLVILFTLLGFGLLNINPINLKPVFYGNWLDYFKAGRTALHTFYMLGFIPMVLPYLKPLHSFPRAIGGVLAVLLTFFGLIAIGAIGVYGSRSILYYSYPSLAFFRVIDIPYLLLEQTGMLIGITWLVIILVGSGFVHYALSLGLSRLWPRLKYQQWAWIATPLLFTIGVLPGGIFQTKLLVKLLIQFGWIPLFVYPAFLWFMALILNKKGAIPSES